MIDLPPASVNMFPPRSRFLRLVFQHSIRDSARLALPPTRFHDSPSDVSYRTQTREKPSVNASCYVPRKRVAKGVQADRPGDLVCTLEYL